MRGRMWVCIASVAALGICSGCALKIVEPAGSLSGNVSQRLTQFKVEMSDDYDGSTVTMTLDGANVAPLAVAGRNITGPLPAGLFEVLSSPGDHGTSHELKATITDPAVPGAYSKEAKRKFNPGDITVSPSVLPLTLRVAETRIVDVSLPANPDTPVTVTASANNSKVSVTASLSYNTTEKVKQFAIIGVTAGDSEVTFTSPGYDGRRITVHVNP